MAIKKGPGTTPLQIPKVPDTTFMVSEEAAAIKGLQPTAPTPAAPAAPQQTVGQFLASTAGEEFGKQGGRSLTPDQVNQLISSGIDPSAAFTEDTKLPSQFRDAGVATSAMPDIIDQEQASKREKNEIRRKELERANLQREIIGQQFGEKIEQRQERGEKEIGGAEARLGITRGLGASSSRIQLINQLKGDVDSDILALTKARAQAQSTLDFQSADRIDAQIQQLEDNRFRLQQAAFSQQLQVLGEQRAGRKEAREEQVFGQEQEERAATFLASQLVDIDDQFNVLEPSAEDIFALAQQSNIDPNTLAGIVNQRIDELNKVSREERGAALSRLNTQSQISGRQFQQELDILQEQRTAELQPGKVRLQQAQISEKEANAAATQAQADAVASGELSEDQHKTAIELNTKVGQTQQFKDMLDIRNGLRGVEIGLSQENGFGDIAAINSFQRMIDPGATVRSEDVTLLQEASGLFEKLSAEFQLKKLRQGDKLPPATRKRMRELSRQLHDESINAFETSTQIQAFENLADSAGIDSRFIGTNFEKSTERAFKSVDQIQNSQNEEAMDLFEQIREQFPDDSDTDVVDAVNEILGFKSDLGTSQKGPLSLKGAPKITTSEGGKLTLNIGPGIVTGFGSRLSARGLDFVLKGGRGARVVAPFNGKIVHAGPRGGFGNQVAIELPTGERIDLSHLQRVNIKVGDTVRAGDDIGRQGNTGSVIAGDGSELTKKQIASGRGTHLDIQIKRPNGTFFTPRQVAQLLSKMTS